MFRITGFADELGPDFEFQMQLWRKMGLSWFELRSAWGKNVMELDDSQIEKVKEISERYSVKVSCIGSPIGKSYIELPEQYEIDRLNRAIVIAERLGCSRIRVFSFYCKEGSILDHRDEVFNRLQNMASIAAEHGMVLLHENESNIYGQHSKECAEIAAHIRGDGFGLVFDPANYSIAGEDSLDSETIMHPYIKYMHVKDYAGYDLAMSIPGEGVSHIPEIFDRLRGLDMFISMEPHLDMAGQFGGATSPDKYSMAVDSVKGILDKLRIEWS